MVRFGICGCGGFVEKAVLPAMANVNNAEVLAVFDSNKETLERVCGKFGIHNKCYSFEEMLEIKDIDVIYIASPNVFHKEQAIAAAKARKHVFCQKPMAMNAAECIEMIKACRENNVKMGIGFCYRFQGAQELAREFVQNRVIGDVTYIYMSFNLAGYNPKTVGWRCNPHMSGGGPLMDIAPHLIDLAVYLLDDRVESVMAIVRPEKTEDEIELDAQVLLQFSNGAVVSIDVSFVRGNIHNYTIVGDRGEIHAWGTMCWNNKNPDIGKGRMIVKKGFESKDIKFETEEHIEKEIRLYCNAIENYETTPVSGEAGLHVQKVIDAIYESGRAGKKIEVK